MNDNNTAYYCHYNYSSQRGVATTYKCENNYSRRRSEMNSRRIISRTNSGMIMEQRALASVLITNMIVYSCLPTGVSLFYVIFVLILSHQSF